MLPEDISRCLYDSDIWHAAEYFEKSKQLEELLVHWMLNGQMWGGVVESKLKPGLVTFGAAIYISEDLAEALREGEHPFLLLDLVTEPRLKREVLDFDEVVAESDGAFLGEDKKRKGLNFYGTLFRFPSQGLQTFTALDTLQESLLAATAGFNIKQHYKHIYPKNDIYRGINSFAMRMGFGAAVVQKYDRERERYRGLAPVLFGQSRRAELKRREEGLPLGKSHKTPVGQLLCQEAPILNLPFGLREVLRLEIEGLKPGQMLDHLSRASAPDTTWTNWFRSRKEKGDLPEYVNDSSSKADVQQEIQRYVRQNPRELRVLPPLTEYEKKSWESRGKI